MEISIHAPIVGCDVLVVTPFTAPSIFQSTHPSWGATLWFRLVYNLVHIFQSTHPSWGATILVHYHSMIRTNFNPRTHRGVRHWILGSLIICFIISIHAPIVGCDINLCWHSFHKKISIHAPIVGCDYTFSAISHTSNYFNPRTHRGVRPNAFKFELII